MHKLKALQIKSLEDGKYQDGGGLILVRKGGNGKWVFRYSHLKKRREMGLGSQAEITLAEARKRRDKWKAILAEGKDPLKVRNDQIAAELADRDREDPTFSSAVETVFEGRKATLRGDGVNGRWMSPLKLYMLPSLGRMRISEIGREDIRAALSPIWGVKQDTAKKAVERTRIVLKGMRSAGYECDPDAVDQAVFLLGHVRETRKRISATPWQEIPALFQKIGTSTMSAQCLRWVMLTVVRSAAARGARKSEIEGDVWTVPAERIKGREGKIQDFRVPLSDAAIEIYEDLRGTPYDLLFPGHSGKALTDQALTKRLNILEEVGRVHGFRTSFRTWVQDTRACDRDVAETILGHKIAGKVEEAYARSDLLDQRRIALEKWAKFVTGKE